MLTSAVRVERCKEGDILAEDVFASNGIKLVVKGTTVNEYIRDRLLQFGVKNVRIYNGEPDTEPSKEKKFHEDYFEHIIEVKNLISELASGKRFDYFQVEETTDGIYRHAGKFGRDSLVKCLHGIKNADEYTYCHCVNTALYCMLIAGWLGLPETEIKKAVKAGLLHDIGKSRVPPEILKKKGPLTQNEYVIMQQHPILGYGILFDEETVEEEVKQAVLMHHERFNGTGYPLGTPGRNLGLLSRIVAIADVYDAMTSDRVYRRRVTPFHAFRMFTGDFVGYFDMQIARLFVDRMAAYMVGSDVLLDNGEKGKIVYVPPQDIISPIVSVGDGFIKTGRSGEIKELL